jgi:hypothetical protein
MHRARLPLTESDKKFFEETGYLYIEDFYPRGLFDELLLDIHRLIALLCEREGLPRPRSFDPSEFDDGLAALLKKDRKLGGIIYEAAKKIPSHIQLACHPVHGEVSRYLLATDFPGFASRGWGLRLDHPSEDVYLTQLHQDYVSQLCSPRGLVFWTPLRRADMALGPVIIYPKSHKRGVFPIEVKGAGSYGLQIHDQDQVEREFTPITPEVGRGDCVIVDCLTLHKSSPNRSNRTRWALISRYFDFNDPAGKSIGWIGGLQEGNSFDKVFPDLVR